MSTPIIPKSQQKKSLSAKKGPVKGLKNVLAQPEENYWPHLKHDHGGVLENLLKGLLPALKRTEIKVPWAELRKMKKGDRAAARKIAQVNSNTDFNEVAAKSVVFGINAVTRLLEKNDTSCILLDSNVNPLLLIKHVVLMAHIKNVPIILISFLKELTLENIGFASVALGLKKHVKESSENYFYKLFEKISELSVELLNGKSVATVLFQDNCLQENEISVNKMDIENVEEKTVTKPCVVSTDVYLYRTSKKERVFEPSNASCDKQKTDSGWTDFIALGDDKYVADNVKVPWRFFESPSHNKNKKKKRYDKTAERVGSDSDQTAVQSDKCQISYKPLKVKRLQGNEFRTKATKPPKVKKK